MDVEFRDSDLDRLETDLGFTANLEQALVKAYRKRIAYLRASKDERDLYELKGMRYEKLKGKRDHQRSLRLNDQWRLILEIEQGESSNTIVVVAIEDYH